jgi:ankyrin repeat protein
MPRDRHSKEVTMLCPTRRGAWLAAVMLLFVTTAGAAESELVDAVKSVDRAAVLELLKQRADVNASEADGTTALYWAAERNDLETARLLVRAGANANSSSRYGISPLLLASVNGNAALIELLIEGGANPNGATPEGETALMAAARTGSAPAITALLAKGAEPNAKEDYRGQTALMWAAAEGHVEASKVLIAGGADVAARSKSGWTALLFAAREGQMGAARVLLDAGASPSEAQAPPAGGSVSPRATVRGAPIPADGPSALVLAAGSNHYELAAYLLDRGADPNASQQGFTALHQVSWLRKPGQGGNGPVPAGSGNMDSLEFVRQLVAHGADVNARMTRRARTGTTDFNMIGATPIMMAARTADAPLMRLLAELGADPFLVNVDNTTVLMAAAGLGTHSPGEDAGNDAEALEAVKVAVELGLDVNAVNKDGDTAMHGAAYKQFPSVVQYLAEKGAKIDVWNTKNKQGWTPLRIAVGVHRGMHFRGSPPTAEALRTVMRAAGVSTEVEPEAVISGATK